MIYEVVLEDDFFLDRGLQSEESCLGFHDEVYAKEMKELHSHIDKVKKIVKPGCSPELLNVALASMASLVKMLSMISCRLHPRASL